jgi:broad specificity phosphatase PhoE
LQGSTLILVRHGATAANVCRPHVLQGLRPDNELIEQGRQQARAAGLALRNQLVAAVYTTPLKRARESAELIAQALGLPVNVEPTLVEADVGDWTGLSWPEIESRWPTKHRAFHDDAQLHGYPGGENLGQVRDRTLPVIQRLAARHAGTTFVVVGHGVVNRVLLAHWMGIPLRCARQLPQDNGGFSTVEFRGENAHVRTANCVLHLAATRPRAA